MAKEETKSGPPIRSGDPRLTASELTEVGFGVAKEGGKWHIVELRFDLKSGNAKVFLSQPENSRDEAIERFKIRVSQSGLLG